MLNRKTKRMNSFEFEQLLKPFNVGSYCEQTYKWSSLTIRCCFTNNCEVFICQRLTWLRRIIQTFDGFNYDWFKNGYFLTILTQCGYFLSELDMERSSCFIILTRESNSCSLVNQQLIFKTFYREHFRSYEIHLVWEKACLIIL